MVENNRPAPDAGADAEAGASAADSLKGLTMEEFAALGDGEVVYRRTIDAVDLRRLFPSIRGALDSGAFYVLFGADGAPRFVSDNERQVHDWLNESGLGVATRH